MSSYACLSLKICFEGGFSDYKLRAMLKDKYLIYNVLTEKVIVSYAKKCLFLPLLGKLHLAKERVKKKGKLSTFCG